jgi:hypothetical protein
VNPSEFLVLMPPVPLELKGITCACQSSSCMTGSLYWDLRCLLTKLWGIGCPENQNRGLLKDLEGITHLY